VRRGLRIREITDSGEMVWYNTGNESLHGTDLNKKEERIQELIQGIFP